jgi:hypothetical protein
MRNPLPGAIIRSPDEDPRAKVIIAAFASEGILFDPQSPNDYQHLMRMKWDIGTHVDSPSDHERYQMTGKGRDPCDTRAPVVGLSQAITNLLTALQTATAAACADEGPSRLNVAARLMELLSETGRRDLMQTLYDLHDIQGAAEFALSLGEPMVDNRPRHLVYDWFVKALAEIYQAKVGEVPLTNSGKAKTSFARIVLHAECLLPAALRGGELGTVKDRATAALRR